MKKLQLENFKEKYFKFLSPLFKLISSDLIEIKAESNENNNIKNGIIIYHLRLNENSSNLINTVHGGAIALIIDNLATTSLLYFSNNSKYKTIDINLNYKNKVLINQVIQVHVYCEKILYKDKPPQTCFIEVEVKNGDEVCTHASIVKSKIESVSETAAKF